MKKSWNIIAVAFLLSWSMTAHAQTTQGTPAASAPAEKNKKATTQTNKPAKEEFAAGVKPDEQGRNYKMIDGRKVQVDNQGVQSLATPKPEPAGKQPSPKVNTPTK